MTNNTLHSANDIYGKNSINLRDDTELLENSLSQKAAVLGSSIFVQKSSPSKLCKSSEIKHWEMDLAQRISDKLDFL